MIAKILIFLCFLTAQPRDLAVENAIAGERGSHFRYSSAAVDLDGDGTPEVLAWLSDSENCGTGGCTLLVLRKERGGYRIVSTIAPARVPVTVSATRTKGWRDLILPVVGGGIHPVYRAVLKFDGAKYPENPTVSPAARLRGRANGTAYLAGANDRKSGIVVGPK